LYIQDLALTHWTLKYPTKGIKNMDRRSAKRKETQALMATQIINCDTSKKIFNSGYFINTSLKGFLLSVSRDDIAQEDLKGSLSLDSLIGSSVSLLIDNMELELDGEIKVTRHVGKGIFEVFIHFSGDTPRYWRECLIDLMPNPGELED